MANSIITAIIINFIKEENRTTENHFKTNSLGDKTSCEHFKQ